MSLCSSLNHQYQNERLEEFCLKYTGRRQNVTVQNMRKNPINDSYIFQLGYGPIRADVQIEPPPTVNHKSSPISVLYHLIISAQTL